MKARSVSTRPVASVRTGTFELEAVFKIRTEVKGAIIVVEVLVAVVIGAVVVVVSVVVCGHS